MAAYRVARRAKMGEVMLGTALHLGAALPDVTRPLSAERRSNTMDEYSMLSARHGEPNTIPYTEAGPPARVALGTANYGSVHVKSALVSNGCVEAGEQALTVLENMDQISTKLTSPPVVETARSAIRSFDLDILARPQHSSEHVERGPHAVPHILKPLPPNLVVLSN